MEIFFDAINYLKNDPYTISALHLINNYFDYRDLWSIPFVILKILLLWAILEALRMIAFILRVRKEPNITNFFLKNPDGKRILIVGDSTAVGRGATLPEDTLAGKLGHDFPNSEIINLGVGGCLMRDVIKQLDSVKGQKFNMVIISAGGNDIVHFTNLKQLSKSLSTVLTQAVEVSDHRVLLLLYSNIGYAPIFPSFIRHFLKIRTDKIHDIFREVTSSLQIPCIKLFIDPNDNAMSKKDRKRLFAADMIHPSSEGYRLWYNRMWKIMIEKGYVFHEMPKIKQ